ncbi:MAG: hypothetical protein ABI950_05895 [Solirubrobacteraceae bacterium]
MAPARGAHGGLVHRGTRRTGRPAPARGWAGPRTAVAAAALELARPHARELGVERELEGIRRILIAGNGADRQRAAHARGGMPAVLELLVAEAATPYGWAG